MAKPSVPPTPPTYITAMGKELGDVFYALYHEFAWLLVRWHVYTELFATKPKTVDQLNRAAPAFFRLVQDSFWDDTLLHLCRLTGEPKPKKGGERLTIRRLPGLIKDRTLSKAVKKLNTEAQKKTAFARDPRIRRIAHTELSLALGQGALPLPEERVQDVREANVAIANVLKKIRLHFLGTDQILFEVEGLRDVQKLLDVIGDGVEAQKATPEGEEA